MLIKNGAWDQGLAEALEWIRVDPFSAEARTARVSCLLEKGNKPQAREEFARIEALAPPDLPELRIRFEKKLK